MPLTVTLNNKWLPGRRFALVIASALLCAVVMGAILYLCSGYQSLVAWYFSLNSCFYQKQSWSTDFFTPGIKSDGNMYCVIAITISAVLLFYIITELRKNRERKPQKIVLSFPLPDLLFITLALIIAITSWYTGNRNALPAHDEIFSAFNAAGIHPFQAVSYYMLPNNHLCYNFLNNILFHSFQDKVTTGRYISLIAYCGIIITVYCWLRKVALGPFSAFIATAALGLQCPVWGFSFQARGYELYLLAGWGMVISLFSYLLTPNARWLRLNAVCICLGYFCMPSFFYLHIAQLVFVFLYIALYKTKKPSFWKQQLIACSITFLLYMPVLCFSGLAAINANKYVEPMKGFKHRQLIDFLQWMWSGFQTFIAHIFSDMHFGSASFNYALWLLPLVLLFRRKDKLSVLFGMFYLTMWSVCLLLITGMKRMPYERNLIAHYSITLAGLVLVAAWVTGLHSKMKEINGKGMIMFLVSMALVSVHFLHTNNTFKNSTLYQYDINQTYTELSKGINYITPGSTVAFSDEAFFFRYVCMKNGCIISPCPTGNETYYMKYDSEPLPPNITENYLPAKTLGDHTIYKHK